MKFVAVFLAFFALLLLTSCSVLDRSAKITYNGEEISLSDVTEMRYTVSSEEEKSGRREITLVPYSEGSLENPVYWVKSGEVWHKSPDCGHIRSGSEVIYGTEENALDSGKIRLCSSCAKKD